MAQGQRASLLRHGHGGWGAREGISDARPRVALRPLGRRQHDDRRDADADAEHGLRGVRLRVAVLSQWSWASKGPEGRQKPQGPQPVPAGPVTAIRTWLILHYRTYLCNSLAKDQLLYRQHQDFL